jgi:hypothetical protein
LASKLKQNKGYDMKLTSKELQQAKLDTYLDKPRWTDNGKPLTMRQRLAQMSILGKSTSVEEYHRKKINGCYAKRNTLLIEYHIDYRIGADDFSLRVPKMVWDWVIAVDETA